jgi:LuxR family maltose regulon positive regulatory protein
MPDSLLSTKLYIPRARQRVVFRPRLIERMNAGLRGAGGDFSRKLTLVSAPAGYGKTTLAAEWLAQLGTQEPAPKCAWLSLEEEDSHVIRFLSYLIAALQQINPAIGAELQPILETETDVPIEPMLTALVNEIADGGGNPVTGSGFVLVLDDYHFIHDFSIHEALDFLIDHIPPCMHLVILTRVDPPIPLGRLRVLRAMSEFRQADLRFNEEEAAAFLNNLMGLDLSADDVEAIEARTEGWIAGLQLAALTLQDRADKRNRIAVFSGSHRHLVDYLAQEVMSRQSREVQAFLLRTSILERFNASLCDAVRGLEPTALGQTATPRALESTRDATQSRAILDQLEASNLFLIALDGERQWYRYHHLFADFLKQRLRESRPEIIPQLFIRASQWYESRGMIDEAMELAFAGGDEVRAARILDENGETLIIFNAELDNMLRWAGRLPVHIRAQFPRLCIYHAWALQFEYHLDAVEPMLALAEAYLADPASLPKSFPADLVRGHASAIRSYMASRWGRPDQCIELSLRALDALPDDDSHGVILLRGVITLGLAIAYLQTGQLEACRLAAMSALPMNQQAGNRYAAISCILEMISADIRGGALNRVISNAEKGLFWTKHWSGEQGTGGQPGRMLAHLRRFLGQVQYERNKLNQEAANLKKASAYYELAKSWARFEAYAALIDVYQAKGDIDKALSFYRKLKQFSLKPDINLPDLHVDAVLAQRSLRLSWARPDLEVLLADAVSWAETSGLDPTDDVSYEREYDYRVLAHILMAQKRTEEAMPLLDRLITSAEAGQRNGELIVYLSLQALGAYSLGESDQALTLLSRALALAEPEGYVRTFVDLGPGAYELLQLAARKGICQAYITKLLSAFALMPSRQQLVATSRNGQIPMSRIDPLNDREMEILRLVSARLSNREIAEELYLSVNTIKWYARNIYDKLGVANRREAASRAKELGIL